MAEGREKHFSSLPQQQRPVCIGDLLEFGIVPVSWVCRSAANDHGRLEEPGQSREVLKVDQTSLTVDPVGGVVVHVHRGSVN